MHKFKVGDTAQYVGQNAHLYGFNVHMYPVKILKLYKESHLYHCETLIGNQDMYLGPTLWKTDMKVELYPIKMMKDGAYVARIYIEAPTHSQAVKTAAMMDTLIPNVTYEVEPEEQSVLCELGGSYGK